MDKLSNLVITGMVSDSTVCYEVYSADGECVFSAAHSRLNDIYLGLYVEVVIIGR